MGTNTMSESMKDESAVFKSQLSIHDIGFETETELTSQILVDYEDDADPKNPKNWSTSLKWTIVAIVSVSELAA